MAATAKLSDFTGATPVENDLGAFSDPPTVQWGFHGSDTSGVPTSSTAVAREDSRSVGKTLAIDFSGSFSSVTNVKMWATDQTLTALGTGAVINATSGTTTYTQYTDNTAVSGATTIPTTSATAIDLSQSGAGTIADGTAGNSKYSALQLEMATDADVGEIADLATLNFTYDET